MIYIDAMLGITEIYCVHINYVTRNRIMKDEARGRTGGSYQRSNVLKNP